MEDALKIPAGHIVVTRHVPINEILFTNHTAMSVADVKEKITDYTSMGDGERYPPPVGEWEDKGFRLHDGRHRYIAALMLGRQTLLVAWLENASLLP